MSETPVPYDAGGERPPATYMAQRDREKDIHQQELRQELIPARQREAAATEAAFAQLATFAGHLGDPAVSDETVVDALRCLMARYDQRRAAKAEVDRLERELRS